MGNTKIEWTDEVWNPVRGCTKISPGCKFCYAEVFAERWRGIPGHPYEQGFDLRLVPEKLAEPLKWRKPRRVFVNSMSDLFQAGVPFEYVVKVFVVMAVSAQHTFQLLTKRPERMREWFRWLTTEPALLAMIEAANDLGLPSFPADWQSMPLPNVWLGVSVENQEYADERIPILLDTPAAVRFISAEPLLGPVDLKQWLEPVCEVCDGSGSVHVPGGGKACGSCFDQNHGSPGPLPSRLHWVIVGGESGAGARPFDLSWPRTLVKQCRGALVACFVKQLGAAPTSAADRITYRGNKSPMPNGFNRYLNSTKGSDPNEWPEDLRVRQFPSVGGGV